MKYTIIESSRRSDFLLAVEAQLKDGWVLIGGVNVCFTNQGLIYYQAMAKE